MSSPKSPFPPVVDPVVRSYLADLAGPAGDPILERLEAHAADHGFPLIGREAGRWLEILTRSVGGRRVFEFGSGFGYSAWFFARAVGEQGEVIGSEWGAEQLEAHRRLFADHPLGTRIHLHQGDALEVFAATDGHFDVVLVDVDKDGYIDVLEAAVPRLRSGGLFLADNALWGGRAAREPVDGDASTAAIRAFNERLFAHPDLIAGILPVGDGLAVGWRR